MREYMDGTELETWGELCYVVDILYLIPEQQSLSFFDGNKVVVRDLENTVDELTRWTILINLSLEGVGRYVCRSS